MTLSVEQLKVIESLATGSTVKEASLAVGMIPATIYGWLKKNPEFVNELSVATDTFRNSYTKQRIRDYRAISKKVSEKILSKIDDGELDYMNVETLVKVLGKTVSTMKEEEAPIHGLPTSLTQNNIQINGMSDKLNDPAFVTKFGKLLAEMDPEDLQKVSEQEKRQQELMKKKK